MSCSRRRECCLSITPTSSIGTRFRWKKNPRCSPDRNSETDTVTVPAHRNRKPETGAPYSITVTESDRATDSAFETGVRQFVAHNSVAIDIPAYGSAGYEYGYGLGISDSVFRFPVSGPGAPVTGSDTVPGSVSVIGCR